MDDLPLKAPITTIHFMTEPVTDDSCAPHPAPELSRQQNPPGSQDPSAAERFWLTIGLVALFTAAAAYLRFKSLGLRSLWHDEFATWHVSQLPLIKSLYWQPELTKPPLYQFMLRLLTSDPRPSEWLLRLPAAVAGTLVVPVSAWCCFVFDRKHCAAAVALLLACHPLHIEYAQEARPYTLLLLGTTLSTAFWYLFVAKPSVARGVAYLCTATLTFHSHYLTMLMFAAHGAWLLFVVAFRGFNQPRIAEKDVPVVDRNAVNRAGEGRFRAGLLLLGLTGVCCVPMTIHYLFNRESNFQGLDWIDPPTVAATWHTLVELGVGSQWMLFAVIPSVILAAVSGVPGLSVPAKLRPERASGIWLLAWWFAFAWGGLLMLSLLGRPALVVRYALPASIPIILFPLFMSDRIHRHLPLTVAIVMALATAEVWVFRATEYKPGIREMAAFLRSDARRESEVVVLTIDNTTYPNWEDMERAIFQYYRLGSVPYAELHLADDGVTAKNDILEDPRGMLLVIGWADPFAILHKAGRTAVSIVVDGESYQQLSFDPYRLVRVAPIHESR